MHAMEYVPGDTASRVLSRFDHQIAHASNKGLTAKARDLEEQKIKVVREVEKAINSFSEAAFKKGFNVRDVNENLSNVMINRHTGKAKIIDPIVVGKDRVSREAKRIAPEESVRRVQRPTLEENRIPHPVGEGRQHYIQETEKNKLKTFLDFSTADSTLLNRAANVLPNIDDTMLEGLEAWARKQKSPAAARAAMKQMSRKVQGDVLADPDIKKHFFAGEDLRKSDLLDLYSRQAKRESGKKSRTIRDLHKGWYERAESIQKKDKDRAKKDRLARRAGHNKAVLEHKALKEKRRLAREERLAKKAPTV